MEKVDAWLKNLSKRNFPKIFPKSFEMELEFHQTVRDLKYYKSTKCLDSSFCLPGMLTEHDFKTFLSDYLFEHSFLLVVSEARPQFVYKTLSISNAGSCMLRRHQIRDDSYRLNTVSRVNRWRNNRYSHRIDSFCTFSINLFSLNAPCVFLSSPCLKAKLLERAIKQMAS